MGKTSTSISSQIASKPNSYRDHLYVLILAGGGGTRLWPQSRDSSPKQFLKLFSGKSLYQLTLSRALKITSPSRIFISTNQKYSTLIKTTSKKIPPENIIVEPMRRDTALAQGIGALYIYHRDPQAVIINLASDHLISPVSTFVSQMRSAAKIASHGEFVTVGVVPTFPHPGLGHIKAPQPHPKFPKAKQGVKFEEKPSLPVARKYTASGHYYWNANLYVWKAKLFLDLLKKHSPKTAAFFPKLLTHLNSDKERQILQLVFQMAPAISVDYAVSEKIRRFVCIPAQFSWTDVGDWKEVWKNLPHDQLGNAIQGTRGRGDYVGLDSRGNLLFLDKQLVATVGLRDMLVIDTPDALLICPKDDAQAVKKVVQALKENRLLKYL